MQKEFRLIEMAKRIHALSETGLAYVDDPYQIERYQEMLEISEKIMAEVSDNTLKDISSCFTLEKEYVTPKVDVRAVIFNEKNQILMIRESEDGGWALPGGWADVGFTPAEVAVKEAKEESGFDVEIERLLGVFDTKLHNHPQQPFYIYRICFACRIVGGEFAEAFDILDRGFFDRDNLPKLSEKRGSTELIHKLFELKDQNLPAQCD